MLKKNQRFLLLTIGATVLLIAGGVTAYSLLVKRNLIIENAPLGSQLVPQDALVTASISTDPTQWQQLRQYGTLETQAALDKQLTQLQQNLLNSNGYNYQKDIQPWLGKTVTIAYLNSATPKTAPGQKPSSAIPLINPPDLIVLPIANSAQAKQLLEQSKSQKITQFSERTYKGIQIRETQKSNSQNYSAAVLGSFFVVSNSPKIIERVIDTYKGEASIATTPGYMERLAKINTVKPFAQVYLNMPAFTAVAAANSTRSLSPENLAAKEQKQGIATTITLEPEGMSFQSISWLKPNSNQKYQVKNTTSRLPRRLPAHTLLTISGGNLAQLWFDYRRAAASNPLTPIPPSNLNTGVQTTLGLDLEKDLLPWMDGEFALALIPKSDDPLALPENQLSPSLGAGVAFMILSSDRSRTEKSLQQLDNVMQTRYQFSVEKTQLNGQPVVKWTSPLSGISATHGWLEGNIVFLTLGAPIADTLVPQPKTSLIQTPLFQQTVPNKPNPNNGQFFLDIDRIINSSNLNFAQLPPQPKMWLQAIRAIGFTIAINDQRSTRFNLFVNLKTVPTSSTYPTPEIELSPPSLPRLNPTPQIPQTPQTPPATNPTPQASQTPASLNPSPQAPQTPKTPLNSSP